MDYQFKHDILGNPLAVCDLEYEGLGDWLSNDLAANKQQAIALISILTQLLNRQISHHQYNGKIYHLLLEQEEVELYLNNNESTHPEFVDSDVDTTQPICGCGLVDFKRLLEAWIVFI